MKDGEPGEGKLFGSIGEIEAALEAGVVTLHAKIKARFETVDADNKPVRKTIDTTPGRMKIADCCRVTRRSATGCSIRR